MCKRGSKVKRLIVELEGLLAVGVEITDGFVEVLRN